MMGKLYKKLSATAIMLLMLASVVLAQDRTVSGTVTDGSGTSMPGVNVVIKGTSSGTTTDGSGKFAVSAGNNAVLVFSFIGYASKEVSVGNRTTLDVKMAEDAQQLSEVVVTAFGIERSTKALQGSVTQVSGENFTMARENSVANGLAGRVAGVNVTKISSGPAGSSRVVIRGAKSLGQGTLNQPLYVIDGVPMTNNNFGQAGVWGGSDEGDGMNSVNPDDIATMTVLKGASAAALYGARAAQGVILITTKKGTNRKDLGIEFNSNYVFETVNDLRDYQQSHGSGALVGATLQTRVATKANTLADMRDFGWGGGWESQAWGPRFDGSSVVQSDGITRKYQDAGDNYARYFKTGTSMTNSLALTGGSETQSFRLSMANLKSEGIIPNSGYDRVNLALSTSSKFGKKLTVTTSMLYSNEKAKNRPNVSDSPGNGVQALMRTPADVNIDMYKGDPNKPGAVPSLADQAAQGITIFDGKAPGEEFQRSSNLWGQNPWWTAHNFINSDTRDRVIVTGKARYDITDYLYVQGGAGMDWSTRKGTGLTPQGTGYQRGGSMSEAEDRVREINLDYTLGFNKTYGAINVNAFFGGNKMLNTSESISANGNNFNVPFGAFINNARDRNYGYGFGEWGINSVYGSAEVSYNEFLYVTATWRQDWFSTLNPELNSIQYPSLGASFVFSDAFGDSMPEWLSFGKLRASYGKVGNATSVGPYQTQLTYSLGNPHLGRPLAYFSGGANNNSTLANPNLIPYSSFETEFGIDVRLFQNRVGLDFTYYSQKTEDDILNAPISRASGFGSTRVNLGELTNKGIEVLLTGTPLKGPVTWNVSLNFARNISEVVSLIGGVNRLFIEEPRTRTAAVFHVVGQQYGMIYGLKQNTSPDGKLIFDSNGTPLTNNVYQELGNGVPDFTGGLNNEFVYKNFNLSFLIDFRSGGDIYSGTNVRLTGAGFHKQTLAGRAGEAPLVISGVTEIKDGSGVVTGYAPLEKTLTPGEAQNYWSQLSNRAQENFMYDGSFTKLRQLVFGYNFPKTMLAKTPVKSLSLSFVGRNLAIIKKNVDNIDPESSYSSSNAQGLDYFGMPSTRTWGFNLRASF